MAFEEVGIRLRTDGVLEATNGMQVASKGLDGLAKAADAASPALGDTEAAALRVAASMGPLGVAMGVVVGVTAGAALAWSRGRQESREFERAIILSGNAAGVTTSQLTAMSAAVGDATVGQTRAAAAMLQMVESTRVGGQSLQRFTELAIRMEQLTGQSVDKTVGTLAKLASDPARAAAKLNETTNFLTVSIYNQIKALEDQGRKTEAGALAQERWAEVTSARLDQIRERLSLFERGSIAAETAWSKFKSALVNFGREDGTLQKLQSVREQINAILNASGGREPARETYSFGRIEALRAQARLLAEQARQEGITAAEEAERAAKVRDAIATKEEKGRGGAAPADPYKAINDQITRRLVLAAQELEQGERLTEAQSVYLALLEQIRAVGSKGSAEADAESRQRAEGVLRVLELTERQRKAAEDEKRLQEEFQRDRAAATQAAEREALTLEKENDRLREETAEIGLNARAVLALRQATIDADIAAREAHIARISGLPASAEEATAIERSIEKLRERKSLMEGKVTAQERKAEQDEADRRAKSVYDSIMDGLTGGFRDGRRPADIFLREFKAQAARTLLKVPVQFISQAVGSLASDFTSLVGRLIGGFPGFGGTPNYNAIPGFVEGHHGGGIAGGTPSFVRSVSPGIFAGARRMHGGGLAGDEVPAILRKGEGVFTPEQMQALGGGGGRSVVIYQTNHIDSRTDAASIMQAMETAKQQAKAELLEQMDRGQI